MEHEVVAQAIEDRILAGELRVGDALPSEEQLAAGLGVGIAGVREAIRVLEAQGVLHPWADGAVVASMPVEALSRFLRLHVALAGFPLDDLTEARIALERTSAENAASQADADAVAEIRRALELMGESGTDIESFNDADTAFHLAIAEAGRNRLFAALAIAIRSAMRAPILDAAREVADWHRLSVELRREHAAILDAIERGEPARAAGLMEAHIRSATAALPGLGQVGAGRDG